MADQVPDASLAYAETRSTCPVARVDGVLGGFWAVLGHDLVVETALDTACFSNVVPFFNTRRPPLECDPPEHRVYRRMLNPHFSREGLAALEGPLRRFALEMIGELVAAGGGDFAAGFSHPFPALPAARSARRRLAADQRLVPKGRRDRGQTPPGSAARIAARSTAVLERIIERGDPPVTVSSALSPGASPSCGLSTTRWSSGS